MITPVRRPSDSLESLVGRRFPCGLDATIFSGALNLYLILQTYYVTLIIKGLILCNTAARDQLALSSETLFWAVAGWQVAGPAGEEEEIE